MEGKIWRSNSEMDKYRNALNAYPEAIETINKLEDYRFNTEKLIYAVLDELEPSLSPQERSGRVPIEDLLSKVRNVICQDSLSQQLFATSLATCFEAVIQATGFPSSLVTALLLYVLSKGIEEFCVL